MNVTDLLITLKYTDREQREHNEYCDLNQVALECL